MIKDNKKCNLCPRNCNIDRTKQVGFCKSSNDVKIAKYCLFFGEEPCLTGKHGCGAIFFSGCSLKCKFCQNYEISDDGLGEIYTISELAGIFKELEENGASHIDLISPTHYARQIVEALEIYKPNIPIIYNTHGYENLNTLEMLNKYIDIYLTDLKFKSETSSLLLMSCKNYFEKASEALGVMVNQKPLKFDENNLLLQGVVVRHLAMPIHTQDSIEILDYLKTNFDDKIIVSLMSQYTPMKKFEGKLDFLNRKLTKNEYFIVSNNFVEKFEKGYLQNITSSDIMYVPNWRGNNEKITKGISLCPRRQDIYNGSGKRI